MSAFKLRRHTARASCSARARTEGEDILRNVFDVFDKLRVGVGSRVGIVKSVDVGHIYEKVGVTELGDGCRESVVTSDTDLLVGNCVVFVDDRNYSLGKKEREGVACVVTAYGILDNAARNKDLGDRCAEIGKSAGVHIDKLALTYRRCRLLLLGSERRAVESNIRESAAYRTRRNEDYFLSAVVEIGETGNEPFYLADVYISRIVGESGGSYLYNYSFCVFGVDFHNLLSYAIYIFRIFIIIWWRRIIKKILIIGTYIMEKRLVLASASPRRSEILSVAGFEFDIMPSVAEEISEGLSPEEAARINALAKAKEVYGRVGDGVAVIGADTVVTIDGKILGKPRDRDDAFNMLKSLSGRKHYVITGYAVISDNFEISAFCTTEVVFRTLEDAEITSYIDTFEPMDKAGSYAIQEKGSLFIKSMNGDFFNVVGLPIAEIAEILKNIGVYPVWQKQKIYGKNV